MMDVSFETNDENDDNGETDNVAIDLAIDNENIENDLNVSTDIPPKIRNKFKWHIELETDDLENALDYLEERNFVCFDYSELKCGQKFYFRCKSIPKERKPWCAKRYTLYFPSNSSKVQILRNQFDHDALLEGKPRPISDEMLDYINGLFECGTTKINGIIALIDFARSKNGLFKEEATPKNRQIEYLLRKFRSTEVPKMLNLGDLVKWCQENSQFPTDINEAFVIAHEASSNKGADLSFRFVLSTPLLLEECSKQKKIAIDATYKLNWLEYPLMVYGTVDRAKKFHPLAYACCSHEKGHDYEFIFQSVKNAIKTYINKDFEPETLIADGADAIRTAFYKAHETAQIDIMCFAHVQRNCNKRPFASTYTFR